MLSIYKPDNDKQQPIIALVEEILAAKKANPSADTSALESEIDEKVFDLYELEKPERDIIRQSVKCQEGERR